jgi:hypothetical protein
MVHLSRTPHSEKHYFQSCQEPCGQEPKEGRSQKTPGDPKKLPWFEHFAREGFGDTSSIHELPYDYSILLENLMDPAHIPISHDRTDISAKRENAKALVSLRMSGCIYECGIMIMAL